MPESGERLPFVKGHGTGNAFVLLPDHDGTRYGERVDTALVSALCDRHQGIGADGVIRVVRPGFPGLPQAPGAEWFMDYYNKDGSTPEMCGNGVRVFVRHLLDVGLVTSREQVAVGTRGGVMLVDVHDDGDLTVDMGPVRSPMSGSTVHVDAIGVRGPGTAVAMPNPHAVIQVRDLGAVGTLHEAPVLHPSALFPEGANVEFVVTEAPQHLRMRVWERGVGETESCGTGVCAAAWVAMRADEAPSGTTYTVDVPGGRLWVTLDERGHLLLRGPAVLVAEGTFLPGRLLPATSNLR
jgi:diaminopimelate epimerase